MLEIKYSLMRIAVGYAENGRKYCILSHSVSRMSTKESLMAITNDISWGLLYT